MGNIYQGNVVGTDLKIGIVVGRFNDFITSKLLEGATDALKRHGVDEGNIDTAWVPGAFEIPLVAKKMAESQSYDAVITLGTVIRGATPQDRKSTRLNSSHVAISYAVFCLKKKT